MYKKCNFSDVTILMTVQVDSIERLENVVVTSQFLIDHFDIKVWVEEYAPYCNGLLQNLLDPKIYYTFKPDDDPIFHRTKHLNNMSRCVETKFISVWDVDVLIPLEQIKRALESLTNGETDFIYPYKHQFFEISPILRKLFFREKDISILEKNTTKMKLMYQPGAIGGAFFAKTECYVNSGLENENFYGWGMEDNERFYRWKDHGFEVKFVEGHLFHLSHGRGINSRYHNPDQEFLKGKEFRRVLRNLKKDYHSERYNPSAI